MKTVHISDFDNILPESVAFISHLIRNHCNSNYDDCMFVEVDQKFAAAKARYCMPLVNDAGDSVLEFWMIYTSQRHENFGTPAALAVRIMKNGKPVEESLGFYQMRMQPYSQDGVLKALRELPPYQVESTFH